MDDGSCQYYVMPHVATPAIHMSGYAYPSEWMWEALSAAGRSEAGIRISAEKALQFAPWFQGISIIAGDVARMPLDIYERQADDNREKRRDHYAYEILNRTANQYMSAVTVRETIMGHALSWGNGYAAIVRTGIGGRPASLIPLAPEVTSTERTDKGAIVHVTRLADQTEKIYADQDVLHIRGYGTGLAGYSVYRLAANSLGLGLVSEQHTSRHFRNAGRPDIVLTHPAQLDKPTADELLHNWEQRHGANPNRPALAAGGLGVTPLPINNQDSQLLENRKFQREEVASWLALPPHKLGSDSRLSYNSIEAEERAYVSHTLMRWLRRWEVECDIKLLTERQKRAWWYFEHNVGSLIQGDFKTQAAVATQLKNAKIITRNEARRKFNMNSVEGGDDFENAFTSGESGKQPEGGDEPETDDTETPSDLADIHIELIADRIRQLARTEATGLKRLAKAKDPITAMERLYERLHPKIAEALAIPLEAYRMCTDEPVPADVNELAAVYCENSQAVISETLARAKAGELPDAMEAAMEGWPEHRAIEMIAFIQETSDDTPI
jgi:HK97 family phage portal protein